MPLPIYHIKIPPVLPLLVSVWDMDNISNNQIICVVKENPYTTTFINTLDNVVLLQCAVRDIAVTLVFGYCCLNWVYKVYLHVSLTGMNTLHSIMYCVTVT